MKRSFRLPLLCGLSILPLLSSATLVEAQETSLLARLPIERHSLPNGLRVVLSPDRSMPTVAIAVYYDVASRNEEVGRSGFAHLFEHMMFEGSANVGKDVHTQMIRSRGGEANGTTTGDRTNYFETLPSNELALGLWLEADRMRGLSITAESFESQREIVKEERRLSVDNQAYGPSWLRRDELAYGDYFPYAHSVLGSMQDLDNAPLSAVQEFFSRYYRPNNAVLTIAGDFDSSEALRLVERYFGPIERRDVAPFAANFSPPNVERRATMTDPHADLPAFHLTWDIPPRRTPDHFALDILGMALGDGDSSRLHQELVQQSSICQEVSAQADGSRGPDLLGIFAILADGHEPQEAQDAVDRIVESIVRNGISERELQKIKNRLRLRRVRDLETNLARAHSLAAYELFFGDATLLGTELDSYLAVTTADVQRVARQYLVPERRSVLNVLPLSTQAN